MPTRVASCWRLKIVLSVIVAVVFCVPYFWIEHHPLLTVRTLPLSWLDRAIRFQPVIWIWVYQSMYVPINVVPWLAERRDDLWRYVLGIAVIAPVSFTVFVFFPIRGPRPADADRAQGLYALLQVYDAPLNCLPSLHAALLVYAFIFGRRMLGREIPRGMTTVCVAWTLLVFYATLATKQHYAIDLFAGTALAIVVDAFVIAPAKPALPSAHPPPASASSPLLDKS